MITKYIAAGLAIISIAGSGIGIGVIFGGFLVALSRNPSLESILFNYVMLGFALTESIALIGFMISLIILFTGK